MADYKTDYPVVVILDNQEISTLTVDDNKERTLITETESTINELTQVFENEGFNQTSVEIKKDFQLCDGFRKNLSEEWDIHVRFLGLHKDRIAIDAEVETSTKYLDHITKPQYWISVVYEIQDILSKYGIQFKIWHKKAKSYVLQIVKKTSLSLREADGKITWESIGIAIVLLVAIVMLWKLFKK